MKAPSTVDILIKNVTYQLAAISDSAVLDAQVIIAHVLGKDRTWVVSHPDYQLNFEQLLRLETAVQHLSQGIPLPYVLGKWDFYGLSYLVSPEVLIPRPETELIVDHALEWCRKRWMKWSDQIRIVDIGTGTGCIAISLLLNLPSIDLIKLISASDISLQALHIAKSNAERHNATSFISFLQSDLMSSFQSASLDLVCANLPYIPRTTLKSLVVANHEPKLALDGGPSGLAQILPFLHQAYFCLRPGGLILAEIEASQGKPVLEAARAIFKNAQVEIIRDYASCDRLLRIEDLGAGK